MKHGLCCLWWQLLSYSSFVPKGRFPLAHNFYLRTPVNFTRVNKVETMYGRSRVNAKVEIITSGDLNKIKDKIANQDNLTKLQKQASDDLTLIFHSKLTQSKK